MRKLKTPEEVKELANVKGTGIFYKHEVDAMILVAQRDALECAAENVANGLDERIVASYILNLLPKES